MNKHIQFFFSKCQFHFSSGGTQRLPRLVGPALAKELIFTGRVLDGEQAGQIGLVNASVEQNEAGDAAYQKAIELAEQIIPNVRYPHITSQYTQILHRETFVPFTF